MQYHERQFNQAILRVNHEAPGTHRAELLIYLPATKQSGPAARALRHFGAIRTPYQVRQNATGAIYNAYYMSLGSFAWREYLRADLRRSLTLRRALSVA